MLTDYHLHLRPDEDRSDPYARWFTEDNVDTYRDAAADAGIAELGCSEHIYRFKQALGLWKHPFWEESARDDLDEYCDFIGSTPLKLGIECDFVPGSEEKTSDLLALRPLDYVVGAVHFVGEQSIDMEQFTVWDSESDADRIWQRYFETAAEAARSGLFDILAHPDLVKVWGRAKPGPERDPRHYYEPLVEAVAESGVAVEISTAGLRKNAGEIYPAPDLARMCAEAGAVFALSSDAHEPDHVGYAYDQALRLLNSLDVSELAIFAGRRRETVEIESEDRERAQEFAATGG